MGLPISISRRIGLTCALPLSFGYLYSCAPELADEFIAWHDGQSVRGRKAEIWV